MVAVVPRPVRNTPCFQTEAGALVERARYSAYGIPTAFPTGDTDFDGDWDAGDSTDIGSNYTPGSAYAVRRDTDLDGDVDAADVTHANGITGGYQTLGRDVLTSAAVRNRIGYAGYQYDPTFAGLDRHLNHVRHRVYDAEAGRWTRRDPLGYVDGRSVYEYARSDALVRTDAYGLLSAPCASHGSCGGGVVGPSPPKAEPPTSPWPGMTLAACTKCAEQAMLDPMNAGLIAEMKSRGCPFGFSGCETCGPGSPPMVPLPPTKAWWDGTSVRLCADRMPSCEYVKTLFAHEVWHAYDRCQGAGGFTCCDCVCKELRSYRWDQGCADGGIRRSIPGPDGFLPGSEEECLRIYVNNSCSAEGFACFKQPAVFDDCFNKSLHDPRCYPSSVDPPPIWIIPNPIFGVTP